MAQHPRHSCPIQVQKNKLQKDIAQHIKQVHSVAALPRTFGCGDSYIVATAAAHVLLSLVAWVIVIVVVVVVVGGGGGVVVGGAGGAYELLCQLAKCYIYIYMQYFLRYYAI